MKKIICVFLFILTASFVFAFDIVKENVPCANVVISKNATEEENYAAKEFVRYIKEISGCELSVSNEAKKGNNIFIGQSACNFLNFDFDTLKRDGIYIECKGDKLILAGDKGSGTIYSVYTFLDEYLGVKYLTPKEDYIPKNNNISVKNIFKVYVPPFWSREAFYKAFWDNPAFCLKLKHNGHYSYIDPSLGGHNTIYNFVHNICWIFSPDVYGKEHPEWYALWGSQRTLSQTYFQLCLTNKEMIEELTKKTLECYEKDPNAQIVDLSIPDCGCYCTCPDCTALTEKYGHSGALLTVINQVADKVKEKYPDKFLETIAYAHVTKAPKGGIVPRDNVIIRLCNIHSDFSKPIDAPENASYLKDIKDWSKISKELFYWSYVIEFGNNVLLYPNFETIHKNHQIMRDNGIVSVFDEGDDHNTNPGCMEIFKMYITMKSLWNPNMNFDKESMDFMKAYYGPAGKDMFDFMKYSCKVFERYPYRVGYDAQDNSWWTGKDYIKGFKYLKSAYNKTKGTAYGDKVLYDLLCFQAGLMIANCDVLDYVEKSGVLVFSNEEALKLMREFLPSHGMEKALEGSVYMYEPKEKVLPYPKECEGLSHEEWSEVSAENFYRAVPDDMVCKVVDDSEAYKGKAMLMTSASIDWYIQQRYNQLYLNNHYRYCDVYISYRTLPGKKHGHAFTACLYTTENPSVMEIHFTGEDNPEKTYKTVKLGTVDFQKTSCNGNIYFAGSGDKDTSDGLFVDRIFYIKHN